MKLVYILSKTQLRLQLHHTTKVGTRCNGVGAISALGLFILKIYTTTTTTTRNKYFVQYVKILLR